MAGLLSDAKDDEFISSHGTTEYAHAMCRDCNWCQFKTDEMHDPLEDGQQHGHDTGHAVMVVEHVLWVSEKHHPTEGSDVSSRMVVEA